MPLICRETNDVLHRRGHEVLSGFLDGKTSTTYKPASKKEEEPVIPAPEIFQNDLSKRSLRGLPTVTDCAIHLEFLETLFVLREKILRSDAIDKSMGIALARETKTGFKGDSKTLKDTTFETRRREKWPKYIEFAVVRFLDWQGNLSKDSDLSVDVPPLDVLMVWHAFLLNPLLFNTHFRDRPIYSLPFPWATIHACIDSRDWTFRHPDEKTSSTANLFALFSEWITHISPGVSADDKLKSSLLVSSFSFVSAPPTASITALRDSLEEASESNPIVYHADMFQRVRRTKGFLPISPQPKPADLKPKTTIFQSLLSPSSPPPAAAATEPKPDPTLATELFDAVLRQNSFIDKMSNHLWIRSPALAGTLRRSIERYSSFLQLLRLDDKKQSGGKKTEEKKRGMMVPTLDIDLAWHTHQCSGGRQYVAATKTLVGRFINHDDTIEGETLGDGATETRRLWRLRFGSEYRKCGCWDCEMLMDEMEAAVAVAGRGEGGEEGEVDMKEVVARVDKKVRFYRAVEAARRKGKPLPNKEELQ